MACTSYDLYYICLFHRDQSSSSGPSSVQPTVASASAHPKLTSAAARLLVTSASARPIVTSRSIVTSAPARPKLTSASARPIFTSRSIVTSAPAHPKLTSGSARLLVTSASAHPTVVDDVIVLDSGNSDTDVTSVPISNVEVQVYDKRRSPMDGTITETVSSKENMSGSSSSQSNSESVDSLVVMFRDKLSPNQISTVYHLAGHSFEKSVDCLCEGPTLESLLTLFKESYVDRRPTKVFVDSDDVWADMAGHYKMASLDVSNPVRIVLDGSPAIDIGGVRREIFSEVFSAFAENKHLTLFQGEPNYLRSLYSVENQSTSIFKVLGKMIAHSIALDGIGFPYLSPVCFWYIIDGVDKALPFIGKDDVTAGTYSVDGG